MNAPRIIPAGPMGLDDILPMIRTLHGLLDRACVQEAAAERGDAGGVDAYHSAAMLEERIRQPIVVAGRTLTPVGDDDCYRWWCSEIMLTASAGMWRCVVTSMGERDTAIQVQTQGTGPTIAAALADADARYQAAIADTLLRMGVLLGEVVL